MDAKSIREALMNRKPAVELLDISLPGLPQLDNQIYVMEISGQDMAHAKEVARDRNGILSEEVSNAVAMIRSLISKEAYDDGGKIDFIFTDNDIDFIAGKKDINGNVVIRGFGTTILLSIISRVNRVSGMTEDFLKQLEPKSIPTTNTGSASA